MGEGKWKIQGCRNGINRRNKRYSIGNTVSGFTIVCMVTDGSYTCDKYSIMYKLFESLCCTPETNVKLCVNCIF